MNKKYLLSLLTCLMMVFALASCGSDDKKDDTPDLPPVPSNVITITNNSQTSFMPLGIVFLNVQREILNQENLGDLYPGETATAHIPGSCATWFLIGVVGGQTYYTGDHLVSETTFTIQANMQWYLAN